MIAGDKGGYNRAEGLKSRLIRKEFREKLNANVCVTDIEVFMWGEGFCSGALAIANGSVWHDLKTLGMHNRKNGSRSNQMSTVKSQSLQGYTH